VCQVGKEIKQTDNYLFSRQSGRDTGSVFVFSRQSGRDTGSVFVFSRQSGRDTGSVFVFRPVAPVAGNR
jgi:hypothetical protein